MLRPSDDCAPASDWLQQLAVVFAKHPDCAIGGRTENALLKNPYSTASELLIHYLYIYYDKHNGEGRFFTANNLSMPKTHFLTIGGFDTTIPFAGGDRNICNLWLHHGYSLVYAPEIRIYHYHEHTLSSFCRQHFSHGCGAYHFRHLHIQRGQRRITFEPFSFYSNLLKYPFSKMKNRQAVLLSALILISQIANAAG